MGLGTRVLGSVVTSLTLEQVKYDLEIPAELHQ